MNRQNQQNSLKRKEKKRKDEIWKQKLCMALIFKISDAFFFFSPQEEGHKDIIFLFLFIKIMKVFKNMLGIVIFSWQCFQIFLEFCPYIACHFVLN